MQFFEKNTNIRINEFVADYIKDTAGIWWFVGVKAFKMEPTTAKITLKAFLPYIETNGEDTNTNKPKSKNRLSKPMSM